MIDVDDTLREEMAKLIPSFRPGDWDEVVAIAGHAPVRPVRRWAAVAAFAATAALVVSAATPLGASIVHGVGNFSSWLTGEPGTPASTKAQQAFNRANARSWIGFPAGTKLRHLTTVADRADGSQVELLGFRAGSTLCLRIVVTGKTTASTRSCAPLADLRQAGSPVRVIVVDRGFGAGKKYAWYGTDRIHSPALQVTTGIVADGVKKVVVRDRSGRHVLPVTANAFLYVASTPDVEQRLISISAQTRSGLVSVPFAPAPFGFGGVPASQKVAPGPTKVERQVGGGTIGWLDRRELRGQPLSILPSRSRTLITKHVVFGRVVAPDPGRPVRVALTLSTSRHGGRATGLCSWLIYPGGGAGGGCAVRADLFKTEPITFGASLNSGSDQFMTLNGLASDDVARIVAFLANGQTMKVPLRDNTYLVDVARSQMPVRLVAYDAHGRVIGVQAPGDLVGAGTRPRAGTSRQRPQAHLPERGDSRAPHRPGKRERTLLLRSRLPQQARRWRVGLLSELHLETTRAADRDIRHPSSVHRGSRALRRRGGQDQIRRRRDHDHDAHRQLRPGRRSTPTSREGLTSRERNRLRRRRASHR